MTFDANIINFSPLPFYKSADEQNAKRWWIYDIYPLYASNKNLLPFQIIRERKGEYVPASGVELQNSALLSDGTIMPTQHNESVTRYPVDVFGPSKKIRITGMRRDGQTESEILFACCDETDFSITTPEIYAINDAWYDGGVVDDVVDIPEGTAYILVSSEVGTEVFFRDFATVSVVNVEDGSVTAEFESQIVAAGENDVIVGVASGLALPIGRYYLTVKDAYGEVWISDIVTVVDDDVLTNGNYVMLEWYDKQDLVADSGVIVYSGGYKNVIYLATDLAKPEYVYEEDGENRDGYFFPEKQISKKRYKFGFYAPEYLLDVLRLVRLADYAKVSYKGREYQCSEILLTPTWESEGDVALVEAEFDTDTVVKAVGRILS